MPEAEIINPNGAFGYTAFGTNLPSKVESFKNASTNTTIAAKCVVAIDTAGKILLAATDNTAALCVGVTLDVVPADGVGKVVVWGAVDNVTCAGAVAAGNVLKRSVTTTGAVSVTATPATGEAFAVAINDSASNVVDIFITR